MIYNCINKLDKEAKMNKLKQLRQKNGLAQAELAARINVSQSTVAMWETGKAYPRVESLIKLAKIFGCSVSDLID